jgi:hypothetical protein
MHLKTPQILLETGEYQSFAYLHVNMTLYEPFFVFQ